nr:histone-lysine N-methyltransferase SETD1B-A-like isoform X1 [Cherax quadricarinatus]
MVAQRSRGWRQAEVDLKYGNYTPVASSSGWLTAGARYRMGCRFSRENCCYSLTCCFCKPTRSACYWIGGVCLTWGAFSTLVDFISANLPNEYCARCLDYTLNAQLSYASGIISAVQWFVSVLLIHGARKKIRWLLLPWLAWAVLYLAMQLLWVVIKLPFFPTIRGFAAFFHLVWGIHYFIVVKTHYTKMALSFTPPEEPPSAVPPNTPTRKHKRRKRRVNPAMQPVIRTLLGVATNLQCKVDHFKRQGYDEEAEIEVVLKRWSTVVDQQRERPLRQGPGDGKEVEIENLGENNLGYCGTVERNEDKDPGEGGGLTSSGREREKLGTRMTRSASPGRGEEQGCLADEAGKSRDPSHRHTKNRAKRRKKRERRRVESETEGDDGHIKRRRRKETTTTAMRNAPCGADAYVVLEMVSAVTGNQNQELMHSGVCITKKENHGVRQRGVRTTPPAGEDVDGGAHVEAAFSSVTLSGTQVLWESHVPDTPKEQQQQQTTVEDQAYHCSIVEEQVQLQPSSPEKVQQPPPSLKEKVLQHSFSLEEQKKHSPSLEQQADSSLLLADVSLPPMLLSTDPAQPLSPPTGSSPTTELSLGTRTSPAHTEPLPSKYKPRDAVLAAAEPGNPSVLDIEPRAPSLSDVEPREPSLSDVELNDPSLSNVEPKDPPLSDIEPRDPSLSDVEPRAPSPSRGISSGLSPSNEIYSDSSQEHETFKEPSSQRPRGPYPPSLPANVFPSPSLPANLLPSPSLPFLSPSLPATPSHSASAPTSLSPSPRLSREQAERRLLLGPSSFLALEGTECMENLDHFEEVHGSLRCVKVEAEGELPADVRGDLPDRSYARRQSYKIAVSCDILDVGNDPSVV